jgi:hypothetical protein
MKNIYVVFLVIILLGIFFVPSVAPTHGDAAIRNACMQTSRSIGLCLYQYSVDHSGHYPEGKTSTEVFQHLIDEKYVTDPSIFYCSYLKIPGKVRSQNDHLKSENVSWDVTCCVDSSAPDGLPVVFLTGYKVTYQAGARAILLHPLPAQPWWRSMFYEQPKPPFLAVCYKNNSAMVKRADDDQSISDFIPANFDSAGKIYRQLTP